jgi:hypothetical protein
MFRVPPPGVESELTDRVPPLWVKVLPEFRVMVPAERLPPLRS